MYTATRGAIDSAHTYECVFLLCYLSSTSTRGEGLTTQLIRSMRRGAAEPVLRRHGRLQLLHRSQETIRWYAAENTHKSTEQ